MIMLTRTVALYLINLCCIVKILIIIVLEARFRNFWLNLGKCIAV